MRAEIGEPLQRERSAEKEDLPAIAGCGYQDPNFDPVAAWKARQAAKPAKQVEQGSLMPCVEAMPNWRSFVGWVEPSAPADPQLVKEPDVARPAVQATSPKETTTPSPIREEASFEAPDDDVTSITLADFDELTEASAAPTMDLGNLDMDSIIKAAAESVDLVAEASAQEPVDEPSASLEPSRSTMVVTLDEPSASLDFAPEPEPEAESIDAPSITEPVSSPASVALLAPKLAGVRPLAHPGRLPRGFELSPAEKAVLRKCNGQKTTQAIFDSGIELDGDALTLFLKRCAKVKLITFKR